MSGVPSLNMEEEKKSDTSVSGETVALQQMVRDLMGLVTKMQTVSVPPPTMGVTTPLSLLSRPRVSGTPYSSRFGAGEVGGVRRALFVQPPVVVAPSVSEVPVETSVPLIVNQPPADPVTVVSRRPPPPRVKEPKPYEGNLQERDRVEAWLGQALNWLRLAGVGQPEEVRVWMFGTLLIDDAHLWFDMVMKTVEVEGIIDFTVQDLSNEFLLKYAGGTTHMHRQQQLTSLVYGKGKCLDVISTQTEFERLASSLYPGASLNVFANELLAVTFADIYKRGDFQLWEKAMEMGPITLDEWKSAIQQASIIRQTVVEGRKALQRTNPTPNRSFQNSSAPARLHQMDAGDTEEEGERKEGEVEVNKMGGNLKNGTSTSKSKEGRKRWFTWRQMQKFIRRGQCFHCYKLNHRAQECPDKDKPAREPTEEELNL
jgi:hypothetical protein